MGWDTWQRAQKGGYNQEWVANGVPGGGDFQFGEIRNKEEEWHRRGAQARFDLQEGGDREDPRLLHKFVSKIHINKSKKSQDPGN